MGEIGPWVKPGQQNSIEASSSTEYPGDVGPPTFTPTEDGDVGPPTSPSFASVGHAVAVGAAVGAAVGGAVGALVGMVSGEKSEAVEELSVEPLPEAAEASEEV
jgi:hypothetical protein